MNFRLKSPILVPLYNDTGCGLGFLIDIGTVFRFVQATTLAGIKLSLANLDQPSLAKSERAEKWS